MCGTSRDLDRRIKHKGVGTHIVKPTDFTGEERGEYVRK